MTGCQRCCLAEGELQVDRRKENMVIERVDLDGVFGQGQVRATKLVVEIFRSGCSKALISGDPRWLNACLDQTLTH